MGSAQQFVYRFNGEGELGGEKVFDMNGDVPLPVVGDILSLHEKTWKIVKIENERWGSVPAFIVYLIEYR